MLAQLQGNSWLPAVRPELAAAARCLPLAALLALPVLLAPEALYPWAAPGTTEALPEPRAALLHPWAFRLRSLVVLGLWIVLALLATSNAAARRPWISAGGLMLLVPSAGLAAQDWALSRDPAWYGSLQGLAFLMEQAVAALALVVLLRRRRSLNAPASEESAGLERTLLTLAIATLWLWFVQFITVWMADLPEEAAWYLRRSGPGWAELKFLIVLPALLGAIALGIVPRWGRRRAGLICTLLLAQHLGHLVWLLWPDAPGPLPPAWLAAAAPLLMGAVGAAWWREDMARTQGA
jgi:hypothetical protein